MLINKERFIAGLLILSLFLCSCGIITVNRGDETTDENTETDALTSVITPPEVTVKDYPKETEGDGKEQSGSAVEALPSFDFDGKSVFFATIEDVGSVFNDESGVFSQAILYRNSLVDKKYNTKLITMKYSAEDIDSEIKKADKSGDYFADFAVLPYGNIGKYYSAGYLRNLRSITNAELDDKCYNSQAMSQLSVGSYVFGCVGYATEQIDEYSCLYINLELAEKYGIELDYGSIYSYEFTWDDLLEIVKSVPDGENSFSSAFSEKMTYRQLFFSAGQTYLSPTDKSFALSCSNDTSASVIKAIKQLASRTESYSGTENFASGKTLVSLGEVGTMYSFKNCGFKWELLPLPKLEASDETYTTPVSQTMPIITALSSGENIDSIGYILRAVNTASYEYLDDDFYRDIQANVITGTKTLDMLDIICENTIYDFASMFGSSAKAIKEGTYECLISAVTEKKSFEYYLSKKLSALNSYLEKKL